MALSPFSATWRTDLLRYLTGVIVGPSSATNNAAPRFDGTTGKLLKNSALLIADTTGAISRSGNGGIPVQGTNTNDNASAGYVGEFVSASVATGSAVSLSTGTPSNVTSVSLTAGDWDVSGQVALSITSTTDFTRMHSAINTSSATLPDANNINAARHTYIKVAGVVGVNADFIFSLAPARLSLSATTTVYLIAQGNFSASTMAAYGCIRARRAR